MNDEKKLYIAYGSNLSEEQMKWRCPDAKIVGKAVLIDWKLAFKVHATIESSEDGAVPVLVWEISKDDEKNLDLYESYPAYYGKRNLEILMVDLNGRNARFVTAMVYIMADGHRPQIPQKYYFDILDDGYKRFGFNRNILYTALMETAKSVKLNA